VRLKVPPGTNTGAFAFNEGGVPLAAASAGFMGVTGPGIDFADQGDDGMDVLPSEGRVEDGAPHAPPWPMPVMLRQASR